MSPLPRERSFYALIEQFRLACSGAAGKKENMLSLLSGAPPGEKPK
jgi:hypothetical protein